MNKKFSTLLATALVAGGLGSSAFAANITVDLSKRIQLELDGQKLVVGESSVRDSLALANYYLSSIYDSHKQNWQLSLTPVKDGNGFVTHYDVYLENQVNGAIALTKEDAAKKSLYYSPGAVVASGKTKIAKVPKTAYDAKENTLILSESVKFGSWKYNSATKTKTAWILQKTNDGVIKLVTGEYKFTGNNPTSTDQINNQDVEFAVNGVTYADDLTFTISQKSGGTNVNYWLNEVGNDGFKLNFSKEVSTGSEFGNVLSANELTVVYDPVYSAASYPGLKAYNNKVKAANAVVAEVADVKTNLQSFAKEMKVALTAAVREIGTLDTKAPNLSDVNETKGMLAATELAKLFAADQAQATAITKLLNDLDEKAYKYDVLNDDRLFEVKDAAKEVKALDEAVKKITDELDKITANASAAIAKVNAAAQDFVKDNYKKAGITELAYDKVKIGDNEVDPAKYINETLAANFVEAKAGVLIAAVAVPDYTASALVNVNGFRPFAVVGEKDTYVAVDTIYVAEREKYLSLGTTTMSKYAIVRSVNDWTDEEIEEISYENKSYKAGDIVPLLREKDFKPATMQYILVPAKGKFATTAFFQAVNYDDVISSVSDSLVITAMAPVNPAEGHYYNEYLDANEDNFYPAQVVIRTLGGRRELSVLTESESEFDAVCTNTRISFEEPALATKIKDGAIYFMINKNVRDEDDFNKYRVVTPVSYYGYAKEAFKNVPGTQWLVEKNNDKYTFNNRDFKVSEVGNQKLFVVGDENDMIYTTAWRDTFQLVEVDAVKEGHLGYKFISEEIQKISDFVLSAVNYSNMETPYYLTFDGNKDSVLTATADKEKALTLIPMIKDDKQVTEEYAMNDKNLSKQYYQLIAKSGKDTLYLDYDNTTGEVFVTKTPEKEYLLQFRSINDNANAYEVWLGEYDEENDEYNSYRKLSYNQTGQAIAVSSYTASAFVYDLVDNSTDIYKNFGFNGTANVIISLNGDEASKVTKVGPFASVKRTGLELRAAAKDEDFVLVMDTAFVDQKDNIRYAYYITKPIEDATKTAWNDEKFYMVTYTDSLNRSNDTIKYSQDELTRIGFVPAKRVDADKLAILKENATAADTLNVTEALGVTNATFAFAIDEDNEEAYRIESNKGGYVSYLNGILVLGDKQQAQLFNVNATDMNPTHNDEVTVEGVSVIAGNGTVTVQGAAGQEVRIATVLGKVVANEVVASDNATIAAPAGVVFVTVNGETTKVVVK